MEKKGKKGTGENGKNTEEGRLCKRLKRRSREEAEGNEWTDRETQAHSFRYERGVWGEP